MIEKKKYLILPLLLLLAITGCKANSNEAPVISDQANISATDLTPVIESKQSDLPEIQESAVVFGGEEILPMPTFESGMAYEPSGITTTIEDLDGNTWKFLLPDEEVFSEYGMDTYQLVRYQTDLIVGYGWLTGMDLQTAVADVLKNSGFGTAALDVREADIYETPDNSYETMIAVAQKEAGDYDPIWIYGIKTESKETDLFWVFESYASNYGAFLRDAETVMHSLEVVS